MSYTAAAVRGSGVKLASYSMLWGCRRDGEVTLLIPGVNYRVYTHLRFTECCCAIALQERRLNFFGEYVTVERT